MHGILILLMRLYDRLLWDSELKLLDFQSLYPSRTSSTVHGFTKALARGMPSSFMISHARRAFPSVRVVGTGITVLVRAGTDRTSK